MKSSVSVFPDNVYHLPQTDISKPFPINDTKYGFQLKRDVKQIGKKEKRKKVGCF